MTKIKVNHGYYGSHLIEGQVFDATDGKLYHDRNNRPFLRLINRVNETLPQKVLKVMVEADKYEILSDTNIETSVLPTQESPKVGDTKTDKQLYETIKENFAIMDKMIQGCAQGKVRGIVISGAPGVGKSHNIQQILQQEGYEQAILEQNDEDSDIDELTEDLVDNKYYVLIKGRITPMGLYQTLYKHKDKIIVFDDCDSVLMEGTSLNLLKAALDSYERRFICWNSRAVGHKIPRKFEFTGTIIFISNIHFDQIKPSSRLSSHIDAIMSRCHFLDLSMKTAREKIIRLKQVISESNLFANYDLSQVQQDEIVDFISEHQDTFREISLRTALKIADIRSISEDGWQKMAALSCIGGKTGSLIE